MGSENDVAKYLYAYMLARNCTGRKFCYEVQSTGNNKIPLDDNLLLIERMYLNPITHIGSSENEIIKAIVLHFQPMNSWRKY